ncbi:hypothetical protein HY504_01575 [Candidatus Wolfebacteria bacterium]|nr:hypothetical protein [Candidatus Wolfebacteria bacterium]
MNELGPYYMTFADKAAYAGPKDERGVILLDYFGDIGRQYNPLAIGQYGLGHYNKYLVSGSKYHLEIAKAQADWLVENLKKNDFGFYVWRHKFRWRYKKYLEPGWLSAHSQGTGISLLGRMWKATGDERYKDAARRAFESLTVTIDKGGVRYIDGEGNVWLEEYIVNPPTHILNGLIWGLWGVYDWWLVSRDERAHQLFISCAKTIKNNLSRYDIGFWSRYDLSVQSLPMIASHFYHQLHIVQLRVMHTLTGDDVFRSYANKWEDYEKSWMNRHRALVMKAIFKVLYF